MTAKKRTADIGVSIGELREYTNSFIHFFFFFDMYFEGNSTALRYQTRSQHADKTQNLFSFLLSFPLVEVLLQKRKNQPNICINLLKK